MDKSDERREIIALLDATDKANPRKEDVAKLRDYLVKHPDMATIAGDMAHQVEIQMIGNALSENKGAAVSIAEFCKNMRVDLGYTKAAPLEQSLIQHVVLCWLRLQFCEMRYERAMKDATLAQDEICEKKLSSHQKRYLRAVESLARVRRLLKEPRSPVLNMLLAQQFNQR